VALPARLQNDLKQFQRIQQDLASMNQQRQQLDMKLRETTHTLEELKGLPTESTIYRPIGGLLIRAKDRKEVEDLLTEEKETLEVRVKAMERQENGLRERYTSMQRDLTEQLRAAGVATGAPAPAESDVE
jgi:prefoldin beta subunit